jgi:hypothetical protein
MNHIKIRGVKKLSELIDNLKESLKWRKFIKKQNFGRVKKERIY